MSRIVFVTGTDTGVGKTLVATALLQAASALGIRAAGFKPVAAGCQDTEDGPRNDDAEALLAASNVPLSYAEVNPYALPQAIAPHIAAQHAGQTIQADVLDKALAALEPRVDLLVVEGAGGWKVPLSPDLRCDQWVAAHRWPVLLVVGMRLGCLNHALLSAEAIASSNPLAGWIANQLPPGMDAVEENIAQLAQSIAAPQASAIGPGQSTQQAAQGLNSWLQRFLNG